MLLAMAAFGFVCYDLAPDEQFECEPDVCWSVFGFAVKIAALLMVGFSSRLPFLARFWSLSL